MVTLQKSEKITPERVNFTFFGKLTDRESSFVSRCPSRHAS